MSVFTTLLKKELIEHPRVIKGPLWTGITSIGFMLLLLTQGNISYDIEMNNFDGMDKSIDSSLLMGQGFGGFQHLHLALLFVGLISLLMTTTYFPKTLRKERTEGSVQFWRSMPVSELQIYASKLVFGLLVIPAICSLLLLLIQLEMSVFSVLLSSTGSVSQSVTSIFTAFFQYVLVMGTIALFSLPIACIAMLISQFINSPLLAMIIGSYAIQWLSPSILGTHALSHLVSGVASVPFRLLSGDSVSNVMQWYGMLNLLIYAVLGAVSFWLSWQYYQRNTLPWKKS
ncbi:ABC transporter permease [Vibrio palustris]|uniref:ABC-2 family transporter protein n=1 Tax=Vibrio palustris TaxID=1918946 RepID=A0A1R4B641_9VIBR|nr:ABC transporter permease [Vibrio palustris]SJL84387.1 hypothetical protein VPAL9027_02370 [Vibrio palustris]